MVLIARLLLALTGAVAGFELTSIAISHLSYSDFILLLFLGGGALIGAGIGFLAGGVLAGQAFRLGSWLDKVTSRVSAAALLVTLAGLVVGLGVAALASLAVKDLPVVGVLLLRVLNVNDLANALKPVFLPGESVQVRVVREGKEENQGVAYLDDGTMVVVEGGRDKVGSAVLVEVTSVLQNPSGKMVFTKLAS